MKQKISETSFGGMMGPTATITSTASEGTYLDKLGKVESGGNYYNKSGTPLVNKHGYTGKYQFDYETAKPFLEKQGVTWEQFKNTPEIQEKTIRMFNAQNASILGKAGYQPTELNMWMAHNMGAGGAKQILSGNVSPEVLSNLRNQAGMNKSSTPQDYVNYYKQKFSDSTLVDVGGAITSTPIANPIPSPTNTPTTPTTAVPPILPIVATPTSPIVATPVQPTTTSVSPQADQMEMFLKSLIGNEAQQPPKATDTATDTAPKNNDILSVLSSLLDVNTKQLDAMKKPTPKDKKIDETNVEFVVPFEVF